VTAADLFLTAKQELGSLLAGRDDEAQRKSLGKLLRKNKDRIFGNRKLVKSIGKDDKSRLRNTWKLIDPKPDDEVPF
jgi:hypothetical protein